MKVSEDFQVFTTRNKVLKSKTQASLLLGKDPYKISSCTNRSVVNSEINNIRAKLNEIIRNKSSYKSLSNVKSKYFLPAKTTPRSISEYKGIVHTSGVDYQTKLKYAAETLSVPEKVANNITKLSPISIKTKLNPMKSQKNATNLKKKLLQKTEISLNSSSFSISGWNID